VVRVQSVKEVAYELDEGDFIIIIIIVVIFKT
jgi:hypothetical protein